MAVKGTTIAVPDTISTVAPPNYGLIIQDAVENDYIHRGYPVTLANGDVNTTLYGYGYVKTNGVGEMYQYNFDFSIGPRDTTDDPDVSDVKSIAVTKNPNKTAYLTGELFDPAGMAVTATLNDGSTKKVAGYTYGPDTALELSDTVITLSYGEVTTELPITIASSLVIGNAEIKNGQFLDEDSIFTDKKADAVILFGEEKGRIEITVEDGLEVYIGGTAQSVGAGKCELLLDTSAEGTTTEVTIKKDDETNAYEFTCYSQACDGLPTSVADYLCVASQYTNGWWPTPAVFFPYGLNGVSTLRGVGLDETTSSTVQHGPASAGNFGGYIVYYYEDAITDNPQNPYGVDFIVYGNSYSGTEGFSEPGNVLVSENGADWYALAGSLHYEDAAIWNYSMTYKKNASGTSDWTASDGTSGTANKYPLKSNYPLHLWKAGEESEMTVTGTILGQQQESDEYENTLPAFPEFGYADCGVRKTTNAADNPYTGISANEDGTYASSKSDGFDLAWAVDTDGKPVVFSNGIHYIKVQTATNIANDSTGEKSTEVNGIRIASAASSGVGTTLAPASIAIDGADLELKNDVYGYNATVRGSFDVNVSAESDANVYISGARGARRSYAKIPDKGMLRIIVQSGAATPAIYYIDLTADTSVGIPAITKNLSMEPISYIKDDPAEALLVTAEATNGESLSYQWYMSTTSKTSNFSVIPGADSESYIPSTASLGTRYYFVKVIGMKDGQSADINSNVAAITVKKAPATGTINVYFTLLGDRLHGNDGTIHTYKKTKDQLQTWISKKAYIVPSDSRVIDVFAKALTEADISWKNDRKVNGTEGNYIQSITYNGLTLEEFSNGELSGWMYLLNGRHSSYGVAEQSLSNGDQIIFHYTDDYTQEKDSEKWNPKKPQATQASATATVEIKAVVNADGIAKAAPSKEDIAAAIEKVVKGAGEAGSEVKKEVVIEVLGAANASSVETAIPKTSVSDLDSKVDILAISTPVGNLNFDSEALKTLAASVTGDLKITVTKTVNINKNLVFELTAASGSTVISDFKGNVAAKLPYTLGADENSEAVVCYWLQADGNRKIVLNGKMSSDGKTFDMHTDHWSKYELAYNYVGFSDTAIHWAKDNISYLAAREVIKGMTDIAFAPNGKITRAQFVQILANMSGADLSSYDISNFKDVTSGDWYTGAVAWAVKNGVANGTGNTTFSPNAAITRQDMAVMITKYAANIDKSSLTAINTAVTFADDDKIAGYSKNAVARMQKAGIISGVKNSDGTYSFNPENYATRAEAAAMIANYIEIT